MKIKSGSRGKSLETSAAWKVIRDPPAMTNPAYDPIKSNFELSVWRVMLEMEKQILSDPEKAQDATDTAFQDVVHSLYNQFGSVLAKLKLPNPSPADVARALRAISSTELPERETKDMSPRSEQKIVEVTLPTDEKLLLGRRPKKLKGRKTMVAHVLHLSLSQQDLDRLERLRDRTNSRTSVDVVRRGLKLYEVVLDATEKGKDVMFESQSNREVRERLRLS